MIELLATLFSVAGSAGFASGLKLVAGFMQARQEAGLAEKAAACRESKNFQAIFAPGGMSAESAKTRRIIAIIIISTCSIMSAYCLTHASDQFVTFNLAENKEGWWIFKRQKDQLVELTLGHLALMYMNLGALTAGFYFTPAGRK